ncbi:hypothetical protein FS837_009080 [Tulasnella sp. UAMH 9824]|nr:hypothetical protein FS837_009080 [Tulasnella sp. UAMH 9824]
MENKNAERCGEDNLSGNIQDTLFLPIYTVISADLGPKKSGGGLVTARSPHLHKDIQAPINRLPNELLLAVFKLHVDADTPAQSLVALTLVFKLWPEFIEGTPNLWCRISGGDGLGSVRKAVTMAKDALLEIWYRNTGAKTYPETFFAEINDRIAQIESLYFNANHIYFLPEISILKTTSAPRLETLHLIVQLGQIWEKPRITLFGGEVASPALKNVHLHQIPVALGSLRLSGLRSLGLSHVPIAPAEELLIILIESPALEDFSLELIVFLTGFNL